MKLYKKMMLLGIACAASAAGNTQTIAAKRPATPADCLNVRRLHPKTFWHAIQIDNEGVRVAYVVEGADIADNRVATELYVKNLQGDLGLPAHLLLKAEEISGLHWTGDGNRIIALVKKNGSSEIDSIDVRTSDIKILAKTQSAIKEFSVNGDGTVVAFDADEEDKHLTTGLSPDDTSRGYRIPFEISETDPIPTREIYISARNQKGVWSVPRRITIRTTFSKRQLNAFPGVDNHGNLLLSLSPDGHHLLFSYRNADALPNEWKESVAVKRILDAGSEVIQTVLYDLKSGATTLPMKSPWSISVPFWSYDSSSYVTIGLSPIGSEWEKEDSANKRGFAASLHTFVVNVANNEIQAVKLPPSDEPAFDEPLAWGKDGVLVLHSSLDTIVRFTNDGSEWRSGTPIKLPLKGVHGYSEFSSTDRVAIGSYESPSVPPELYIYDLSTGSIQTFAKLNPQFKGIETASLEIVHWKTSTGYDIQGMLIKPPDFVEKRRYPLVIQTQPGGNELVCDSGPYGYPSSIPLPLSDAGVLYLYRTLPRNYKSTDDQADYPKGYPGDIAQAAWQMDVWDSAVESLSQRGIVDPANVGLIGFSRTGWYTEFALAHAKTHYRAGSVADNVQYSLGEYWLSRRHFGMYSMDHMYGGSPYGEGLKNWLQYSISFNLDKIHTPLLMEQMGYGVQFDSNQNVPFNLAPSFEILAGLDALHRPVELYYYPNETHQMDHPKAKLENLQRNVDWFRFWLQGYERPHPEDPDQYKRWEHLRELQDADAKAATQMQAGSQNPN
jgi:dipeptidyl aminopeptidase/acylaminoacyl peptidase